MTNYWAKECLLLLVSLLVFFFFLCSSFIFLSPNSSTWKRHYEYSHIHIFMVFFPFKITSLLTVNYIFLSWLSLYLLFLCRHLLFFHLSSRFLTAGWCIFYASNSNIFIILVLASIDYLPTPYVWHLPGSCLRSGFHLNHRPLGYYVKRL